MIKLQDKWGYLNGILIAFTLLLIGFLFNSMIGGLPWSMPGWPNNLWLVGIFSGVVFIWGLVPGGVWKQTLTQVELYWPGTILLLIASAIWVNIPVENPAYLKLFAVFSGFTFLFLFFYLMLCYALVLVKDIKNWNRKMIFIRTIHIGLILFLASVFLGHADYYQLQMKVGRDRAIFSGINYDDQQLRTPFAVKLMDFQFEGETPGVLLIGDQEMTNDIVTIRNQDEISIGTYSFTLDNYLPKAIKTDAGYQASDTATNGVHAVYVMAKGNDGTQAAEGWITSGSDSYRPLSLPLDDKKLIFTLESQGNRKASIRLFDAVGEFKDFPLDDHSRISYKGWSIKQGKHDVRYGERSPVLDLTLTFDRWLEIRIAGVVLILLSLIGLWVLRKK